MWWERQCEQTCPSGSPVPGHSCGTLGFTPGLQVTHANVLLAKQALDFCLEHQQPRFLGMRLSTCVQVWLDAAAADLRLTFHPKHRDTRQQPRILLEVIRQG